MKCAKCGSENGADAKLCGLCGAPVAGRMAKNLALAAAGLAVLGALGWGGYAIWYRRVMPERAQKAITESSQLAVWLEKAYGSFKNNPEFEQVKRLNASAESLRYAGDYENALVAAGQSRALGLVVKKKIDIKNSALCASLLTEAEKYLHSGQCVAASVAYGKVLRLKPSEETAARQADVAFGLAGCREELKKVALIPAGEFQMGAPDGEGESGENPRHKVRIDAYYIDKYEVTAGQYEKFAKTTGRAARERGSLNTDRQPAVNVNWYDAAAYCKWAGGRLPTEAEWEKAARGKTNTKYNFGVTERMIDKYAWYDGNSNNQPHPVGQKKPNQYGLYDMHGNVWEWVADWYDESYYKKSPKNNPKGPDSGLLRGLRGGSWSNFPADLRAALRSRDNPGSRSLNYGFRCVVP